jgi:hypothetical protein
MNTQTIETEIVENRAIAVRPSMSVGQAMGVDEIIAQVHLVQKVMQAVMKEGEHYGKIAGCGDRKVLLQPGAQKLTMTFRLCPEYEIQEVNMDRGHKEYRIICTLKTMGNGSFVGQGVGCCSTMESKYRFRGGARKCPKCGQETIIKGKAEYGGGWLCFQKKGGCGAKWDDGAAEIESQSVAKVENDNPSDHYNCVTPDTKLLTHDLQWVPAGEIESGDTLIGVNEDLDSEYARCFAVGEATAHGKKVDDLYEISFEDGRTVRCNGEHKWLVKKIGLKGTEWMATEDIQKEIIEREGRPRHWTVMSVCHPWEEDTSKEAGYIAGLLDADGSLGTSQLTVLFAQQENIVLSLIQRGLHERGYRTGIGPCKSQEELDRSASQKQVYQMRIRGGLPEQLRLLGSIRPPRLLERWLTLWDLSKRRLEGRGSGAGAPMRITSITSIGKGEVVMLGTSCRTYIANGFVCHNTVLKMAKKRAFVDATITATAASDIFTQDIGDDGPPEDEEPTKAAPRPASKPAQAPTKPAPTPAPEPKQAPMATEEQRTKMILQLKAEPGGENHAIVTEYFVKAGCLFPTENLADLPLHYVPSTVSQMRELGVWIGGFTAGEPAIRPNWHPSGLVTPEAKPATNREGRPFADDNVNDQVWRTFIVPIPRKGQKRDEYLKSPDTIGSLYDNCHGNDEESTACRQRLFGFVHHFQPTGWEKRDGTKMPPSDTDHKFRTMLDQFKDWHTRNHPDEKI